MPSCRSIPNLRCVVIAPRHNRQPIQTAVHHSLSKSQLLTHASFSSTAQNPHSHNHNHRPLKLFLTSSTLSQSQSSTIQIIPNLSDLLQSQTLQCLRQIDNKQTPNHTHITLNSARSLPNNSQSQHSHSSSTTALTAHHRPYHINATHLLTHSTHTHKPSPYPHSDLIATPRTSLVCPSSPNTHPYPSLVHVVGTPPIVGYAGMSSGPPGCDGRSTGATTDVQLKLVL